MFRHLLTWAAVAAVLPAAAQPYGLDTRTDTPAYLSMPATEASVPALLSGTGAFGIAGPPPTTLIPSSRLVPYDLIQPFWSDGAVKTRWIALPYNSSSGTNPQVTFSGTGDWAFPDGTVFVKQFDLVVNEQTGATRRLETRVLVRKQGGHVYGRSYRWRQDGTDADAVEEASANTEVLTITQADGTTRQQTWTYPRPSQCVTCHTVASGGVLGVKTRQLNRNFTYDSTGRTDNQLRTWGHLGMLSAPYLEAAIPTYPKVSNVADTSKPLLDRARSYLDANCSSCHRPGAAGQFDARYDTPIAQQLIFGFETTGANKLVRGSASASRIIARDSLRSSLNGMPPLAKDVVDTQWIALATALVNQSFDVRSVTSYLDATKVRIAFNEPVSAATGTNPANYSVPGYTVQSASLSADLRIVSLALGSAMTPSNLSVTVNGVKALASPNNEIWPGTVRFFSVNTIDPNGDEDLDGIPNGLESGPGDTTNVYEKDNDIFANARLYAMQQYRDFLGREGDASGVNFWTGQLTDGAQTRGQMAETFFNSAEFQGTGSPVVRLYFAYFLRIPDYDGLNFWIAQFRNARALESISNAFAGSPEFTNRYGTLNNSQFVALVYQNVLGRAPDGPGLAHWTGQLDGGMTRGRMMIEFSESAEYRALIGNEVYVTMMYQAMLRRAPDAGGFSFWVDYMDQGNSGLALTNGFVAAPEYRSRFLP